MHSASSNRERPGGAGMTGGGIARLAGARDKVLRGVHRASMLAPCAGKI